MKLPINKRLLKGPLFCLVYAHVYEEERRKHEPRGIACVYLGYDDANNTYKVKEWVTGKRYYTADLTFHANTFPYRSNPSRTPEWLNRFDHMAPRVIDVDPAIVPQAGAPRRSAIVPEASAPRRSDRQRGYRYSSGQALRDMPDVDEPPHVNCTLDFDNYMIHCYGPDPSNWGEALRSKHAREWIEADLAERRSFDYHQVLKIVPRSDADGKKIFKPKRVMKIKVNPPNEEHPFGSLEKFKVRMTIAAYTKMLVQGIDYEEKYASTVRWNSIKILIAIAVRDDLDIVLFDISSFFLYGELSDRVYMEQPEGWETEDKPRGEYITQLQRGMYGLPQAGHGAQRKLKETLTANDKFQPTTADDCVYVGQDPDSYSALGAHVDGFLAIGDAAGLKAIETTLSNVFKITKKCNPTMVTGVQIDRHRPARWLKLHQTAYITDLLKEYGMTDCKPTSTPIDPAMAKAMMLLPTTPEDIYMARGSEAVPNLDRQVPLASQ